MSQPDAKCYVLNYGRVSNMTVLPPPSKEVVEAVYSSLGLDEKRVKESVKILKEWLELQPHLPHVMDEKRLENIFLRSKASIEGAKSVVDMYYTVRTAAPEFLSQRDPEMQWFKNMTEAMYYMTMPKLTEDNYRVIVGGLLNKEVKFDISECIKMTFMCQEVILSEDCSAGLVLVFDAKNATISMVALATPTALQKAQKCLLKGFRCRMKAFHFLNVPSYAVPVINLLKSLLKPKLASRVFVHPPGYELLHKHISPKILPQDFGGDSEPVPELWDAWKKKHHSLRDWYLNEDAYKADESRRPGKALTSGDLFGIEGSFRQLTFD